MEKTIDMMTFDELLKLPIDIESCFDPIFDPPADFVEEWRGKWERASPFSCTVTRKIGNTWYTVETECDGNEPLTNMMRRLFFSSEGAA